MKKAREAPELRMLALGPQNVHNQEKITVHTACAGLSVSGEGPLGVGFSWMFAVGSGEDGQVRDAGDNASHLNLDTAIFSRPECPHVRYFCA